MADNKNMALNDEAMANATGGAGEDLPLNKYNVGNRVIVAGYEDHESTIIELKGYGSNGWSYQVRCVKEDANGHEAAEFPEYESNISPV